METLNFRHRAPRPASGAAPRAIVGVVASGNLDVLVERTLAPDEVVVEVTTSVRGFGEVWAAVVADFVARWSPGGLRFSVNDGGARPDTVSLRLAQALARMTGDAALQSGASWYEASARQRITHLLDPGSFTEFLGPEQRITSPSLPLFDLPVAFDDGMVVGRGRLDGRRVLVAAQEGRFMGGAIGEVHGAKLLGLLRAARDTASRDPVLILFDSGGVRLQEANAGEVAVAEIMRAVIEARLAGVNIIGLIGGRAGCYGGASLIAGCCSHLVISEQGRLSVTGPEVIETNRGIEEFDSRDRALVWRTMGGKHRCLIGAARYFADDTIAAFRAQALAALASDATLTLETLRTEQSVLAERLVRFGDAVDATSIWRRLGIEMPEAVPDGDADAFLALLSKLDRGRS